MRTAVYEGVAPAVTTPPKTLSQDMFYVLFQKNILKTIPAKNLQDNLKRMRELQALQELQRLQLHAKKLAELKHLQVELEKMQNMKSIGSTLPSQHGLNGTGYLIANMVSASYFHQTLYVAYKAWTMQKPSRWYIPKAPPARDSCT